MQTEVLDRPATEISGPHKVRRHEALTVVACSLLAAALCLYRLTARSMWIDEAVTFRIARTPPLDVVLSDGGNMAAYYLFLRGWMHLGDSLAVLRLPSVMFAVAGVVFFYLLVRRWFDVRVASVASLLLAAHSSFIYYGQEARSYSMELMLVVASWLVLSVALERRTVRWFLLWGLVNALAVSAQLFAVLLVAAQLASLLFVAKKLPWRAVASGLVTTAVAAAPVLLTAAERGNVQISWVPPPSIDGFRHVLLFLGGANFEPSPDRRLQFVAALVIVVCLVGWTAGAWTAVRKRREDSSGNWVGASAVLWLIVPLASAVVVSLTYQPLLVPRFFIALVPAHCLLLAVAVVALPSQTHRRFVLAALVVLGFSGVVRSYGEGHWELDRVAAHLVEVARPGERVVVLPFLQKLPFEYHLERTPGGDELKYLGPISQDWEPPKRSVWGVFEAFLVPSSPEKVGRLASRRERFWLVTAEYIRWDESGGVRKAEYETGGFIGALGPGFRVTSSRDFGRVVVLRIDAPEREVASRSTSSTAN
ncbi:MAG TPA: glycosyltransferase family 39 protein [Actinomycetota bacterium]|nr:glycosyltransferase family 39 protein [Actinomycetota bacterium]